MDGRDLGLHGGPPWCHSIGNPDGDILLKVQVTSGYRSAQDASIRISQDGVDVQLPWSHVVFKPNDCARLELTSVRQPANETTPAGNSGTVHADCKLPDASASLHVDATFWGC
jgi:hypothetical protein